MEDKKFDVRKLALEPWEVGGELLDILSRGLYSDAKDAIREYAQNGLDAKANTVMITVDGPRLVIRDDGSGMDRETLRRARRFGISDKSSANSVGYRGIGIYSAFGMCESLTIRTHKAGSENLISVRFSFGSMRRMLEQDRAAKYRVGISLADLLYEHTEFTTGPYPIDHIQDHFTVIEMEGIGPEYRVQLSDLSSLNSYLLNTLPVAFPKQGYGTNINKWLKDCVGIDPIKIVLRIGNEPEIEVSPEIALNVEEAQYTWVKDSANNELAFVWHVLSNTGSRLNSPEGSDENSGTSGFLLRLKGFTLGGRGTLKPLWPPQGGRTLYHHYTGEVHIIENADVYPNAARDDLEPNASKQILLSELRKCFETLNRRADLTREIKRAQRRLQGFQDMLVDLRKRTSQEESSPYESYHQSRTLIEFLEKAHRDLPKLKRGRKALDSTPAQAQTLKEISSSIQESKRSATSIANAAEKRLQGQLSSKDLPRMQEVPPQAAVLEKAMNALKTMFVNDSSPPGAAALHSLESAVRVHSITKAIAVLDGLRADGLQFTDELEASRKDLRILKGWSPTGPVTLEEALAEFGFSPVSIREQALIEALDRGLLNGFGGRGQRYEVALRSVAESVGEEERLQYE